MADRRRAGARLQRAESAVSRLLFHDFERARSGSAFGPNGLCRGRSNDWRVRPGGRTGSIPRDRSADVHRWAQRGRLRKKSWAGYVEDFQKHEPFKPDQALTSNSQEAARRRATAGKKAQRKRPEVV